MPYLVVSFREAEELRCPRGCCYEGFSESQQDIDFCCSEEDLIQTLAVVEALSGDWEYTILDLSRASSAKTEEDLEFALSPEQRTAVAERLNLLQAKTEEARQRRRVINDD